MTINSKRNPFSPENQGQIPSSLYNMGKPLSDAERDAAEGRLTEEKILCYRWYPVAGAEHLRFKAISWGRGKNGVSYQIEGIPESETKSGPGHVTYFSRIMLCSQADFVRFINSKEDAEAEYDRRTKQIAEEERNG